MFVSLGGERVIDAREVVAVLDARQMERTPGGRALLSRAAGTGAQTARALVVTTRGLVLSVIAPATVARRLQEMSAKRRGQRPRDRQDAALRR